MELLQIIFNTSLTTFGFLFILSFLVIIHELGHLLTAIWMKVKIEEFGIGYPPLAKVLFHWKGIPFTLNWLPFGGFVRMEGEDGPEKETVDSEQLSVNSKQFVQKKNRETHQAGFEPFYEKTKAARLIVLLAGVFINFLFGIIAFSIVYTITGLPRTIDLKVIDEIVSGSPADQAGIKVKDTFVAAQSTTQQEKTVFNTTTDVVTFVNKHLDENVRFFVDHEGQEKVVEMYLRPVSKRPANEGALGILFAAPQIVYDFYPWWQMPFRGTLRGFEDSMNMSAQILMSLKTMFSQLFLHAKLSEDLAGPFGIVHQATKFGLFQNGWAVILQFAGMLSMNLAILNFLPIPALDGGRAFFVLAEGFIGRKRREFIESKVNYFGFAFLLGLIILISIKDIWSILLDMFKYFRA